MASRLMKMPSVNLPNPFPLQEMQLRFGKIRSKWWPFFQQAAAISKVPVEILAAKCAVESGGEQVTANHTYVGLMQIGKSTILDALNFLCGEMYADGAKWKAPAWMTTAATPVIRRFLPTFNPGAKVTINSSAAFAAANRSGEFNVLMGAIYLYALMTNPKFMDGDMLRLDKVMSGYNTGPNLTLYSPNAKQSTSDTSALLRTLKSYPGLSSVKIRETTAHILKFTGTNGAFDLVFNKGILKS